MKNNDMRGNTPFGRGRAIAAGGYAPAWLGALFSLSAAFLSDFALPWGAAGIQYELATSGGLVLSAWLMSRFRWAARPMALAGALLCSLVSLFMGAASGFPGPFILLRLGLAMMLAYTFWKMSQLIALWGSCLPFTLCALAVYAGLSLLQLVQLIGRYFAVLCLAFSLLAAVCLLLAEDEPTGQGHRAPPPQGPPGVDLGPLRRLRGGLCLGAVLLVLNLLYNGFDMFLFSRFSQASSLAQHGLLYPGSILLIGVGYFLGGLIARRRGFHTLFIGSCALMQLFLLVALVPEQGEWMAPVFPLYVLASAGADLCLILLPMWNCAPVASPLVSVAGVVVFRFSKLYFIPTLLTQTRAALVLTILLALVQMLIVIYMTAAAGQSRALPLAADGPPRAAEVPLQAGAAALAAPHPPALPAHMTPREREVAQLLLAGHDRAEIAAAMGIAFSTVNKHCVAIFRKTECASHLELLNKYGRDRPPESDAAGPGA